MPAHLRKELDAVYSFARGVSGARIAIAGVDAEYPLFGPDLTNHVQYIGHRGKHGAFDHVLGCREWRRLLNDGDYDYVVTAGRTADAAEPVEAAWTRSDPAAMILRREGTATVFRIDGPLAADACDATPRT